MVSEARLLWRRSVSEPSPTSKTQKTPPGVNRTGRAAIRLGLETYGSVSQITLRIGTDGQCRLRRRRMSGGASVRVP